MISTMIETIDRRFHIEGSDVNDCLERLIIKRVKGEECSTEMGVILKPYTSDVDSNRLQIQLSMLPGLLLQQDKETSDGKIMKNVISALKDLRDASAVFSEVKTLMKIPLVLPSSSASAKRSFSALRRIKTYLHSTMTQSRLNSAALLHIQQK